MVFLWGGGGCEMRWISGEDTFTQCLRLVRFLGVLYVGLRGIGTV